MLLASSSRDELKVLSAFVHGIGLIPPYGSWDKSTPGLVLFITDPDEGMEYKIITLQITLNVGEWSIQAQAELPLRGTMRVWRNRCAGTTQIHQGQMQSPACGNRAYPVATQTGEQLC